MNLDQKKTQLQETGCVQIGGLTFREVGEIITDLGLDFEDVWFTAFGDLVAKGIFPRRTTGLLLPEKEKLKPHQLSWLEQSGLGPEVA